MSDLCYLRPFYGTSTFTTGRPILDIFFNSSMPDMIDKPARKSNDFVKMYIIVLCLFILIELFRGLQLNYSIKWILEILKEYINPFLFYQIER